MQTFLERKNIRLSFRTYFVDAMGAMAYGLFASLLMGTIFGTIATKTGIAFFGELSEVAKSATGAALGVAIANALGAPPLVLFSAVAVGISGNSLGGPVGAFIAVIFATEFGKLVSKETKVDIIVTPAVTLTAGLLISKLAGPAVSALMNGFGALIMSATAAEPILMGIMVSVLVGIALTLPISSAAICLMLNLGGTAAGAATAGCCAQMIGFAFMSYKENKIGGLLSQGLGTSMLQMPNIVKNPYIWLPPILTSAVTGPIATKVFALENIPIGAGMGTCGLVGPFGVITAMPDGGAKMWVGLILVCFVLPAVLTPLFAIPLQKAGKIKDGDMTLPL